MLRLTLTRRFGTANTLQKRFYAGAREKSSDKETTDYLEKMMDEEVQSQETSEHVDPDYWRDPGSHNDKPESSGVEVKQPYEGKRSQASPREQKSAGKG